MHARVPALAQRPPFLLAFVSTVLCVLCSIIFALIATAFPHPRGFAVWAPKVIVTHCAQTRSGGGSDSNHLNAVRTEKMIA